MQLSDDDGTFKLYVLDDFLYSLMATSIPTGESGSKKPMTANMNDVRAGQSELQLRLQSKR